MTLCLQCLTRCVNVTMHLVLVRGCDCIYNTSSRGVWVIASPSQILLSWRENRFCWVLWFICRLSDTPSQIGKLDSSRKKGTDGGVCHPSCEHHHIWYSICQATMLPHQDEISLLFVCDLFFFTFPLILFLSKPARTTACNYAFLNIRTWLIWLRCSIFFHCVWILVEGLVREAHAPHDGSRQSAAVESGQVRRGLRAVSPWFGVGELATQTQCACFHDL
jgi:hypothetical protein